MNRYRYNGKELDEATGLYDYGFRWYDPAVGRWNAVDPLAEQAPDWSPYRYGFDNPILYTDPDGQFESKDAAKDYAQGQGIRTGFLSRNKIVQESDGSWAIENRRDHTTTSDLGEDFGVMTFSLITPNDILATTGEYDTFWEFETFRTRGGEEPNMMFCPVINTPWRFCVLPIKMGKICSLEVTTLTSLILPNERQNAHGTNITKNARHWPLAIQIYLEPLPAAVGDAGAV